MTSFDSTMSSNPYCRRRATRRIRVPTPILLVVLTGLNAGCTRSNPAAPMCTGPIEIDLSRPEIHAGDTFTADADHRVEQCLQNLSWSATGSIQYQFAEALSATFRATAEGAGTITVRNRQGNLGVLSIDVSPPEPGASR
jgi:hypothetical protein